MPADLRAIADPRPPATVAFPAGQSHVGTRRPALPEDGEGLVRTVKLAAFRAEAVPVTNARFAAFVAATGYVTEAEAFGWAPVFRGLLRDPASLPPSAGATPWWGMCDGASWFAPEGPGSSVAERPDHPVTQISWADACRFADWAGGRLPTEAEWERTARGHLEDDPTFPWGEREPDERTFLPANIWQGRFPDANSCADGWLGTSPVGAFPETTAGLFDMVGNVWEWCSDPFLIHASGGAAQERNALAQTERQRVMKGGSFLCHRSYCYRYRIAARSGVAEDSGSSNTGLRVFYAG